MNTTDRRSKKSPERQGVYVRLVSETLTQLEETAEEIGVESGSVVARMILIRAIKSAGSVREAATG